MDFMKSLICALLLSFSLIANAQEVPKNIIVEHFTNTKCGVCANWNPKFYAALAQKPNVIHVSIHPSSPFSNCLFSTQNKSENDARTQYYNLYGSTPRFKINGETKSVTEMQFSTVYDAYENQTSPFSISSDIKYVGTDSISVTVEVTTVSDHNISNLDLFVPVVEDSVFYSSSNGEKAHYDVLRKSMSGDNAIVFSPSKVIGDVYIYQSTVALKSIWEASRLYAIAILNDNSNKALVQSAKSELLQTATATTIVSFNANGLSIDPSISSNSILIKTVSGQAIQLIHIYDMNGNMVFSRKQSANNINVDVSSLDSAVYNVIIVTDQGSKLNGRFVKK